MSRPLLVRPKAAAEMVGSEQLWRELVAAKWVTPTIQRRKLTLYNVARIVAAVDRIETQGPPPQLERTPAKAV